MFSIPSVKMSPHWLDLCCENNVKHLVCKVTLHATVHAHFQMYMGVTKQPIFQMNDAYIFFIICRMIKRSINQQCCAVKVVVQFALRDLSKLNVTHGRMRETRGRGQRPLNTCLCLSRISGYANTAVESCQQWSIPPNALTICDPTAPVAWSRPTKIIWEHGEESLPL